MGATVPEAWARVDGRVRRRFRMKATESDRTAGVALAADVVKMLDAMARPRAGEVTQDEFEAAYPRVVPISGASGS